MADRYGYDASNNNRPIDWAAVPPQDLWYFKADEGVSYVDPYLRGPAESRAAIVAARGEPFGVYHFGRPSTSHTARNEVDHFLAAGGDSGQLRPVLDIEATQLDPHATAAFAVDFCHELRDLTPVEPVIYTGAWFLQPRTGGWMYPDPALAEFDLWLSAYPLGYTPVSGAAGLHAPLVPAPWHAYLFWQFTSSAPMAGYAGGMDRNVVPEANWSRLFRNAPAPKPAPQPEVTRMLFLVKITGVGGGDGWYLTDWVSGKTATSLEVSNFVCAQTDVRVGVNKGIAYNGTAGGNYLPFEFDAKSERGRCLLALPTVRW